MDILFAYDSSPQSSAGKAGINYGLAGVSGKKMDTTTVGEAFTRQHAPAALPLVRHLVHSGVQTTPDLLTDTSLAVSAPSRVHTARRSSRPRCALWRRRRTLARITSPRSS